MDSNLPSEAWTEFNRLGQEDQQRLLRMVRALNGTPRGTSGKSLARLAGQIDPRELDAMQRAIKAGCEQVDLNEW